jgi:hypothetical protein
MATAVDVQPSGVAALSRAVVAAAADFVVSVERAVVGESKIRTARSNAWDAIQADRARAQAREDMNQLVRVLLANGPRTALHPGAAPNSSNTASAPNTATPANTATHRRTRTKALAAAPR